jgi:predicted signal transduction protein with EAL and GGDEF domain
MTSTTEEGTSGASRILIVDRDARDVALYRAVLAAAPRELTVCDALAPALEAIERSGHADRSFSLCFVDARFAAGRDGAALAQRLHEIAPAAHAVLVGARRGGRADGLRRGFSALLRKPLDAHELATLAALLIDNHRAAGECDRARAQTQAAQRIGELGYWHWKPLTDEGIWCAGFARLFGLVGAQVAGSSAAVWRLIHPEDRLRVRAQLARAARENVSDTLDYRVEHPRTGMRHLRQETSTYIGAGGASPWVVSAVQDITERDGVEDTIRKLAYFDPLTELPNRSFLNEHLRSVLVHARRHGRTAAILHVDLDSFKRINDTLGHIAGDRLLCEAAQRIQSCVRDSDCVARDHGSEIWSPGGSPDTVARFGADEFIVVLSEVASTEDPERVARRIIARLGEAVHLDGREVTVSASIGIAVFPADAEDEDALLRNAAVAMHSAKRHGRNTLQCFNRTLLVQGVDRLSMEARLRQALESGGLTLHYQPKMDAASGRLCGAEALLRWRHPDFGAVAPSKFIPIAEECGLIVPLGEWVLRRVCEQIAAWRNEGLAVVPVSINVSAYQLQDHALVVKVCRELDAAGLTPPALEFEITESVLMEETGAGEARLRELRSLGSLVSMDDFGTGYSSLSYLKRLPIDVVKIDRSFVRDILGEEDDQAILRAIITMAHQLRLRIVAEGVESQAQLDLLRAMHCDLIQGYVISPPLPAQDFASRFLHIEQRVAV